MSIDQRLAELKLIPTDIFEHLDTLYDLAKECDHITEFGTRHCISTTAFLAARPSKLICYDIYMQPEVALMVQLKENTEFVFHRDSTLNIEIEETDMLFIDTLHTYEQLKCELKDHPKKVRKYLVFHDTVSFGYRDEVDDGQPLKKRGLNTAICEFMEQNPEWVLKYHFYHNNGLTVLQRQSLNAV